MSVIKHNDIHKHFKEISPQSASGFYPVYLVYGEEMLVKNIIQFLLEYLLPEPAKKYGYEAYEGTSDNILTAIQQLNTYSLLDKGKVVALIDCPLFTASPKGAAPDKIEEMDGSTQGDSSELLAAAITDTFPQEHYLIITTDTVDKRRRLYKTVNDNGLIVDCSVPKGDRQADKIAQDTVLRESMQTLLKQHDKILDASAYAALCEMTGFDLRTFLNNLGKLIDYVGDRKQITVEDVGFVLERTKQDPIYAFTNAISERNAGQSIFYMDSLLRNGYHELQLLAAGVNQFRKLLIMRLFVSDVMSDTWPKGLSFNEFREQIMPTIQEHDLQFKDRLKEWNLALNGHVQKADGDQKQRVRTDLLIAPNPKNAYPVYKQIQKAVTFTQEQLLRALRIFRNADLDLKSSGHTPRSIMANAILKICNDL